MVGMRQDTVAVVLVNWRTAEQTIRCLDSVVQLEAVRQVVLVENGSGDDSWDAIHRHLCSSARLARVEGLRGDYRQLRIDVFRHLGNRSQIAVYLVQSSINRGFAGGCNLGMGLAIQEGATHLLLLNNDARCDDTLIHELLAVASKAPIVGARIFDETGQQPVFQGGSWPANIFGMRRAQPQPEWKSWPSFAAHGAAMLVNRDCAEAVRNRFGFIFDDKYFMYCEETDFCLRAASLGFASAIARDAKVYHQGAGSSGGAGNPRSYYYLTRNRVELARRWLPRSYLVIFHLYYLASRTVIVVGHLLRARLFVARAIIQGLRDAYTGRYGRWRLH
jgi:GT2 family glycosyltransferase